MDEIVRYQLRKPAASAADNLVLQPVAVKRKLRGWSTGCARSITTRSPHFEVSIDRGMQFRGDTGDFLELAGNLLDNACKWCDETSAHHA